MSVAVVTGANSGIGLATAIRLAQDGHEVYGAMRDIDKAGDLRDACLEAGVDNVNLLRIDVTNDHVIELAFKQVVKQSGPVDILVNNAGIGQMFAVEDCTLETYQQHIDTNYLGAIRCIKQVLPAMRERASGNIVNITSTAGRYAATPMSAYVGSKFALEGFSEVLAQEVAPYGIRVCVIEPGTINTPIFTKGDLPPSETFYPMHYERMTTYFLQTLLVAPGPELVADTISKAISSDAPTFRHVVGDDAHALLSTRKTLPDEELIAMGALTTDEWYDAMQTTFGLDLRP